MAYTLDGIRIDRKDLDTILPALDAIATAVAAIKNAITVDGASAAASNQPSLKLKASRPGNRSRPATDADRVTLARQEVVRIPPRRHESVRAEETRQERA